MKQITIVTHPGRAHLDDFLSVCWLLGGYPDAVVHRREPTQDDLDVTSTWVVDIGRKHEPIWRNFDHHQMGSEEAATCALQLLLEYELGVEEAHHAFPWLRLAGIFDSKGPGAAAAHLQIPADAFKRTGSPVERAVLELFAEVETMDNTHPLMRVMRDIGMRMRERPMAMRLSIHQVQTHLVVKDGLQMLVADPFTVSNMTYPMLIGEVMDFKRAQTMRVGNDPVVSISPNTDSRGPAWTLYRYGDNPRIDFARIEKVPGVLFAHANGFLAKVRKEATLDDLYALIQQARTDIEQPPRS